jgi:hypothetical protein
MRDLACGYNISQWIIDGGEMNELADGADESERGILAKKPKVNSGELFNGTEPRATPQRVGRAFGDCMFPLPGFEPRVNEASAANLDREYLRRAEIYTKKASRG